MRNIVMLVAAVIAAVAAPPARAESSKAQAALAGLREVKVAFDLTNGHAKSLLRQLDVIDETRRSLIEQRVTPHLVITFRGPATRLVQTDQSAIKPEDRTDAAKIAKKVEALRSAAGVASLEQCNVAVRLVGTKPENVLPGIKVVGNGFISLMAYQEKGYAYIKP